MKLEEIINTETQRHRDNQYVALYKISNSIVITFNNRVNALILFISVRFWVYFNKLLLFPLCLRVSVFQLSALR